MPTNMLVGEFKRLIEGEGNQLMTTGNDENILTLDVIIEEERELKQVDYSRNPLSDTKTVYDKRLYKTSDTEPS